MYFIALPIFLITAFFLGRYLSAHEKLHHNQTKFLHRNLLFPYVLAFVLGIVIVSLVTAVIVAGASYWIILRRSRANPD